MGLLARGDDEEERHQTNQRAAGGPPEGEPGTVVTITLLDAFPPLVLTAVVQSDGYFDDEVYRQIAAARAGS